MIKKMLVGFLIDGKHSGIDKYLLGFASVAKENGVVLDFLTDKIDADLKAKLNSVGFGLLEIPSLKEPVKQYNAIKDLIEHNCYDAVYCNISEAFNCMLILAAANCNVKIRIVHSHSAGVDRANKLVRTIREVLHKVFKVILGKKATVFYACSDLAGKWMFTRDFEIINNAINIKKFAYDVDKREAIRKEFGISEDTTALVHVGNMCYVKNNFFLIDVMDKLLKSAHDVVLICVGTGVDEEALKNYTKELCIENKVIFTGVRSDVAGILSAADIFLFPSRFEGLGFTAIEAQASGLPCIISDKIPKEVKLTDTTFVKKLDVSVWARAVRDLLGKERKAAQLPQSATERFSFENTKAQLVSILERE